MPSVATEPEELVLIEPPQTRTGGPNRGGPNGLGPDGHGGGGGDGEPDDGSGYVPGLSLLGMRIMLVSITTLFVVLSLIYLALSRSPKFWQPIQVPRFLWLSTATILMSSWSLHAARGFLETQQIRQYARWLCATVVLGFAFLGAQLLALRQLTVQGLYLRHNPHSSMFYVVTGIHGVHLLAGLAMLMFLVMSVAAHPGSIYTHFERERARGAVVALYWHFLDGLWIGMFLLLLILSR
jgi:cytochrome c oxidase subunit III